MPGVGLGELPGRATSEHLRTNTSFPGGLGVRGAGVGATHGLTWDTQRGKGAGHQVDTDRPGPPRGHGPQDTKSSRGGRHGGQGGPSTPPAAGTGQVRTEAPGNAAQALPHSQALWTPEAAVTVQSHLELPGLRAQGLATGNKLPLLPIHDQDTEPRASLGAPLTLPTRKRSTLEKLERQESVQGGARGHEGSRTPPTHGHRVTAHQVGHLPCTQPT